MEANGVVVAGPGIVAAKEQDSELGEGEDEKIEEDVRVESDEDIQK